MDSSKRQTLRAACCCAAAGMFTGGAGAAAAVSSAAARAGDTSADQARSKVFFSRHIDAVRLKALYDEVWLIENYDIQDTAANIAAMIGARKCA